VDIARPAIPYLEIGVGLTTRRGPHRGTRVDIASWLHGLGLQQYDQAFRDNAIDASVLPELTAEDLRDIGVGLAGTGANCSPRSPHYAATPLPIRLRAPRAASADSLP
jgi:SAM domain (Sterile alpha motif)